MRMYADCEDIDHYYRDGCVWDKEIDSYDTSSVQVIYSNGTQLTYSLNAYLPYEGQYICFSGENGRLDVRLNYRQPWETVAPYEFRLAKNRETTKTWTLQSGEGGHGGGGMGIMAASLVLSATPIIVFYLALQKYIVKGIAAGAVKG